MSSEAIKCGAGTLVALAVAQQVGLVLAEHSLKCIWPGTGALAVLLFCMPGAPASQPKTILLAHLLVGIVGVVCLEAYPEPLVPILPPTSGAVVIAIVLMKYFGAIHPPAAAYAFLFVMQKLPRNAILTGPGMLSALVLIGVQQAFYLPVCKALEAKALEASKAKKA